MIRNSLLFFGILVAHTATSSAQCPGTGCRLAPPVSGQSSAQAKAAIEAHAIKESAVLTPLKRGLTVENCAAAIANAKSARRPDLLESIATACRQATH